jgi:cysteine desulfurase / selenocysteine lyase
VVQSRAGWRVGALALDSQRVRQALARERINVSVTATSSAVMDAIERDLPDLVRASVHYFNTDEEINRAVDCVRVAARLSHLSG